MYAGMPVSSLLSRSPGPCQTNQPSPIAGMIAATTARPTSSDLVVLGPRAPQDRDEPLRAEHRGEHEAAVEHHEHHRDAGPHRARRGAGSGTKRQGGRR